MRQRGNFRLLLNANLWPQMPVSMMDGNKVSCTGFCQMLQALNALHTNLRNALFMSAEICCDENPALENGSDSGIAGCDLSVYQPRQD